MFKGLMSGIVVAGLMVAAPAALASDDPTGVWRMANGKVTVKLDHCGSNFCGTIIALAQPLDKQGQPKRDRKNPNPGLRDRPVVGITILNGMRPNGDNQWAGRIYNADDGHTYASYIHLTGNVMNVKGCVAFICKGMKFVRVMQP